MLWEDSISVFCAQAVQNGDQHRIAEQRPGAAVAWEAATTVASVSETAVAWRHG